MSEFYRMDFKGTFSEETSAIPASNITTPNGPVLKYVYVIVGIYAVILTIILIIIIVIVIKKLRDSFCPPSCKNTNSGYGTILLEGDDIQENCPHRQIGELNPVVDIFERSIESEYDNVSLDQVSPESVILSRAVDVPPEYEHPPAYRILEPI